MNDAGGFDEHGAAPAYDEQAGAQAMPVLDYANIGKRGTIQRIARFMLCASIFLAGWSLLRVGPINLTLSDVLLMFVLVVMLFRTQLNTRPFSAMTVFWFIGLALMLGGLLLSTVVNGVVERWVIVAGQYLFAFLLIPMILMGQETTLTRRLPALFVLGITVSQLIGVSASLLFEPADTLALMGKGFLTGNGRVGAMTGEPNSNGAMIAYALPMLFYCIQKRTIPLGIGLICGAMLVWGLLASGSFTGFAASVIAVSVFLVVSGLGLFLRFAVVAVVGAGLFVASGLPLPETFEDRVAGAISTGDLSQAGTFTDRSKLIEEAWQKADDHVFIGQGVDQYRVESFYGAPVHELHLLIWNEGGAIAFVGLLMLLLILIGGALSAITKSRMEGAMILAVVAVFMVYSFSIPHMYSRQWILPVLLAISTFFALQPAHLKAPKMWYRS
ncbi:O-antigen ligase family protein [Erythrobacter sp. MTPC3]